MGTGVEMEIDFAGEVVSMEKDDLVLVVAQVAEGVKEGLLLVGAHEGVGEDDDEGAAVELLGGEMEGSRERQRRVLTDGAHFYWLDKAVEEAEEVVLVDAVGTAGSEEDVGFGSVYLGGWDIASKQCETEGVALAVEKFDEHGGGVDGESEFVGVIDIPLSLKGEKHGFGFVDEDLAA